MNDRQANSIRRAGRPGFTMVEILLASMILAIGFLMLLPAFTVGLAESRDAIEGTTAAEVAQNAAAYCNSLLTKWDPNWSTADATNGYIHAYEFNKGVPGMTDVLATDASTGNEYSIRIHGDPGRSRFYWNLLYRFHKRDAAKPGEQVAPDQPGTPDMNYIELWVMVCKRNKIGGLNGLMTPKLISVSGSSGSKTINSTTDLVPGTSLVTESGEILNVMINNGGDIVLDREITTGFSKAWIVEAGTGDDDNACIYAAHTKKAF